MFTRAGCKHCLQPRLEEEITLQGQHPVATTTYCSKEGADSARTGTLLSD